MMAATALCDFPVGVGAQRHRATGTPQFCWAPEAQLEPSLPAPLTTTHNNYFM